MPASTSDLFTLALQSSFNKKNKESADHPGIDIEDQLYASTKQIFLHDIEFETSKARQNFILNNLKSKYVTLNTKGKKTGNSQMPQLGEMAYSKDDKLEEPKVTLWSPEKVVLGWRKTFPPGSGMVNLGNTCYMNSSLQALFHIPSLVNWLLEEINTHIPKCESNPQNASFCSICCMMRTLKLSLERGNNVIKPSFIHSKLKCIGKTLMYGRQEDAHEFIKLLLDHMEKSFLQFKGATKLDHRSKETTPLNQIFGGYLRQQVICPLCHYVSTTFSHFQDIVLDIRSVGSVDEALNLYFRKETLDSDNAYKCEKCHKKVPATKRHLIEKAPHVLLLQLKRFTISGGKITKHVNIQKNIDISRYVNGGKSMQPNGTGPYFYRLVSMVIHIGGSQHGGHYTAVAEASNNTMFEFDDASVRQISVQSALLRNPYILFYEMVRKPKSSVGPKQVIRQSSEKTLLRQSSSDKISKPLPTSLSTNCMWNGVNAATNDVGEVVNRNGLTIQNKRSPLLSHKERDKVSFGIKSQTSLGQQQQQQQSQNESKFFKGNSLGSHNGSLSKAIIPYHSNAGKTLTNGKISHTPPGLVPYNDDSDTSDEEKVAGKGVNGHSKCQENGFGKSSCNNLGNKTDKVLKDSCSKVCDKNSLDSSRSLNGMRINGGAIEKHKTKKINNEENSVGDNQESRVIGRTTSFLPRSVQIHSSNSLENGRNNKSVVNNKLLSTTIGDKQQTNKTVNTNSKNGGTNENRQFLNGCAISKVKSDCMAETTQCETSSTSFQVPGSTEKHKSKNKHEKVLKERESFNGWTVTPHTSKPDLEKSLSHDCVLPSKGQGDKSETVSLKSKESLDSNRSDKSSRSMKKSLFSLFPCVSSTHSPDLSPDEEQLNSVIENKSTSPVRSDPKRKPERDESSPMRNSSEKSKNSCDIDDTLQSKRNRDKEEHEPLSPSKKCRPEERQVNVSGSNDDADNSRDSEVSERLQQNQETDDDEDDENAKSKNQKCPQNGDETSLVNNGCERNKNERNLSTRDEENFSMEEKKSRHKKASSGNKLNYDNSYLNSSTERSNGEKNLHGESRLNPNVVTVNWNRHVKDLSDNFEASFGNYESSKSTDAKLCNRSFWKNGEESSSVVKSLKEAGELPFGVKINTWEGEESTLDKEILMERRENKKRAADDLYNEEYDKGKVSKKRYKQNVFENLKPRENPFQKFQSERINNHNNGNNNNNNNSQPNNYSQNQFRPSCYNPHKTNNAYRFNKYRNRSLDSNFSKPFHHQNRYRSSSYNPGGRNKPDHWHYKGHESSRGGRPFSRKKNFHHGNNFRH